MQQQPLDFEFETPQNANADINANSLVKFFHKLRPNKAKDVLDPAHADMPSSVDVLYIDIRQPGSRDPIIRPATAKDTNVDFPRHYNAFKSRTAPPTEGFPLADWPGITRSQVEELSFFNIKTVEHLANMADVHTDKVRGLVTLKQKAKVYLDDLKDSAASNALVAMNKKLEATNAALEERLAIMEARFAGADTVAEPDTTPSRRRVQK